MNEGTNAAEKAAVCRDCSEPIFGGPNCWHTAGGGEVCPIGSILGHPGSYFHEPPLNGEAES